MATPVIWRREAAIKDWSHNHGQPSYQQSQLKWKMFPVQEENLRVQMARRVVRLYLVPGHAAHYLK